MQLSWENRHDRELCEDKDIAIAELGVTASQKLQSRLSDLFAARTVDDLHVGNPRIFGESPFDKYKIDLADNYELIFCPSHPKKYYLNNGHLDWSRVSKIKLLSIAKSK